MSRLDTNKFDEIQLGLASPEMIFDWSFGEVTKPETINYKSQKPESDGLFCEKIFGPAKDWECSCGKYKKVRYKGTVCERCGVEVISSSVRRERMGHISLAAPASHIWHLKGSLAPVLNITPKRLEEVVYFVSHIVIQPDKYNILAFKEVLPEREARMKFAAICEQIEKELPEGDSDKLEAAEYAAQLKDRNEPFEFHLFAYFIKKHAGAQFGIGAEAILEVLKSIDLKKELADVKKILQKSTANKSKPLKRLEIINSFITSGNKPEWMIVSELPVLPPELRPMIQLDGGRFTTSDLNDLYRRVIIRNTRLQKLMTIGAPAVILMNEKRMLQEAVDALIDNGRRNNKPVTGIGGRALKSLSHSLKGKQGRFRQNLLGKRADYSGRSVIAVGPEMEMDECGLPRMMALKLFKPFVISKLVERGIAPHVRTADKMCEALDNKIWPIVEEVIDGHPVLLNRAPTLHRLGIQAFKPKLVKGKAIRLHPLVTPAFNADFDGDQMAVHVPLSKEAKAEALVMMLGSTNILGPKDGKPIVTPSQDMVLGNYYLTREAKGLQGEGKVFKNSSDVVTAYDNGLLHLHAIIAVATRSFTNKDFFNDYIVTKNGKDTVKAKAIKDGYLITTPGKIIFNEIFPEGFPYFNEGAKGKFEENLERTSPEFFVPRGGNIAEAIAAHEPRREFDKKVLSAIILGTFKEQLKRERAGVPDAKTLTSRMLDKMKDLGFVYSTKAGVTIAISDITNSDYKYSLFEEAGEQETNIKRMFEKGMLTDDERHMHVVKTWTVVKEKVQDDLSAAFDNDRNNPIYMMADSGARGNISNFTQLAGMRGLMASPSGKTIELPIKSSFRDGLTVSEFFISTHGSRKGAADTALKTAESGYLTRRLVDVAQDITIKEMDCGTDTGFIVEAITDTKTGATIVPLFRRIEGRYAMKDVKKGNKVFVKANEMISEDIAQEIVDAGIEVVEIRSAFTCTTTGGVCEKCYGKNLATAGNVMVGEAVGVMAAQSIGEPGTQLTMRTFHTGGVAGGSDITQGLPRVQELIEAREPKAKAIISEVAGKVSSVEEKDGKYIVEIKSTHETRKYKLPYGALLRVKKGDKVDIGSKITDGPISPKELLEVADVTDVQNYILKEIQKVYGLQGIEISDKHIEVMVNQMLRKVVILDEGDTNFIAGQKVDKDTFTSQNTKALKAKKKPAYGKPLLLGITRAALATDSFLSAASFQETTRILRDAAVGGKSDTLNGLKENVILGKLIPAGTGRTKFKEAIMSEYEELVKVKVDVEETSE